MPNISYDTLAQLRFIDDAIRAKPRMVRIFLCGNETLDAIVKHASVGHFGNMKPTLMDFNNKSPYDLEVARKGTAAFEIYDTRSLTPELAGEWARAAKERIYPWRYENQLFMAMRKDHYELGGHENGLKFIMCIADLSNPHHLANLREENEF